MEVRRRAHLLHAAAVGVVERGERRELLERLALHRQVRRKEDLGGGSMGIRQEADRVDTTVVGNVEPLAGKCPQEPVQFRLHDLLGI
jgi:hypothetical protein